LDALGGSREADPPGLNARGVLSDQLDRPGGPEGNRLSFGTPRFHREETTSTNDLARAAIRQGAPEGALFTASHQTIGRGRRGTEWHDAARQSALMSFVVYPPFPLSQAWLLSYVASLAAAEALIALAAPARIKWPNDLLVGEGKAGGVLVETVSPADRPAGAVIGIGINVLQESFPAAGGYALPPTSLRMVMGHSAPAVEQVIAEVAASLGAWYAECVRTGGRERVMTRWKRRLVTGLEQTGVSVETGRRVSGILRDVRIEDGIAIIEEPGGTFASVRPVETAGEASPQV